MKISKIVIKDIEIILGDEQVHEEHEHKCQCSKGEDNLLNSLGSMVEVFSETITDYLKEELSGKKKVKKDEVKKKVNNVEKKYSKVQEIPIIKEVKLKEESKPILEKVEPEKIKKEKVEEVEKVLKPENEETTDEKKVEGQRKNFLNIIDPSNDLNDFINKILNNIPDK